MITLNSKADMPPRSPKEPSDASTRFGTPSYYPLPLSRIEAALLFMDGQYALHSRDERGGRIKFLSPAAVARRPQDEWRAALAQEHFDILLC